jgi:integrase
VRGHIERRRRGLYAVVEVPPVLRQAVGRKRLRKTLATSDMALARLRLTPILDDLNAIVEAAQQRCQIADARTLSVEISPKAENFPPASSHLGKDLQHNDAHACRSLSGPDWTIEEYIGEWLSEAVCTPRTRADHWRAVRKLQHWGPLRVASVDRQKADDFIVWMRTHRADQWTGDRRTIRKYLSSLSGYWKWMQAKGLVVDNPWLDQPHARIRADETVNDRRERAFTDEEIDRLLNGPTDAILADLMRIGALTGARLEAIVSLRVKDCIGGNFRLRANQNETRARLVPIHSELAAIVRRRAGGKRLDALLFEEVNRVATKVGRQSHGSLSTAVGKRFGRYLRSQHLAVQIAGRRRSLINFESFRRWFIEKAANAGQPETVIAAVVGYRRGTISAYSAGPGLDILRGCVEAVLLPGQHRWREPAVEPVGQARADGPLMQASD